MSEFKLLDADGAVFFQRELEFVRSQTYDVKLADIRYPLFFPVTSDAPRGAESIVYQTYDGAGEAKIIADYAKDFPRADVAASERVAKIKRIGSSFAYSLDEIESSQLVGKSLDARRALRARRAIEEQLNSIAWFGDTEAGLDGLQLNTDIPSQAATGTFAASTPDQILAMINGGISKILDDSKGVHSAPKRIALPILQYSDITTRRIGDTGETILSYIVRTSPWITSADQITWANELKLFANSGTEDVMWIYEPDPMNLNFEVPQMVEMRPTQEVGMEFWTPMSAKCAGLQVHYPLSMLFVEGV